MLFRSFGTGDIDSTCVAEGATSPPAPEGAPVAAGGDTEGGGSVPSGEYYHNRLPGDVTRAVRCGEDIRSAIGASIKILFSSQ